MMKKPLIISLLASAVPFYAAASDGLRLPDGAVLGYEQVTPQSTISIAIGPFQAGQVESVEAEGAVTRRVWKTPSGQTETLGLLKPLRSQLEDAGYSVLFECETRDCGGFDFRFKADVVDEPEMHVDLGDFRYLAAERTKDGFREIVSLLISHSPDRGYVQMTELGQEPIAVSDVSLSTKTPSETDISHETLSLKGKLSTTGAVALEGLEFLKGSSELSGSPSEGLRELAGLLADDPAKTVILVGHTDASGTLEGNVALSRKRANSVLRRLVDTYGVDPSQLSAEGVGYLSPRASNATAEGRDLNRRVEVVLTTQ